ncbi:hypothetical protein NQ024_12345, partial [Corynebacterium sp. 35RC1]|nr:hypothetical protein [Corynebacterium sp. 35RC1]
MARIDSGIAVSEVGVSDQYGTVLWNDRPAVDQRLRQINRKALPRAILNRSTQQPFDSTECLHCCLSRLPWVWGWRSALSASGVMPT